ncbi:endonuclease/exonuclease/phosphatase family protein [Bremerella sp. JC770]|uniref:endonuclease/exonuclease/phosphatase family protein n=1 Tax=Bremerella sp. JC770 TaxID=3232137 RepID=UPI003458B8FE
MIRSLPLLVLTLVTILVPSSALANNSAQIIRVLSYNIHYGKGRDGKLDLKRIAKIIQASKADIVLLQEVDSKTKRSLGIDQPRKLSQLTGMHFVFGPNIQYDGGEYGNAILTRYPIISSDNYRLPNLVPRESRGVLSARLQLPEAMSTATCRVLTTHWDHGKDEQNRLASADALQRLSSNWSEPVLLGGDLNATPDSEAIRKLSEQWQLVGTDNLPTFPAERPQKRIDYIAYRSQTRLQIHKVIVLDEPIASDHRPVLVELQMVDAPN